MTCSAAYHRTP